MNNPIYRVAYISHAKDPLTSDELHHIEECAIKNNRLNHIYGVLVTDRQRIIQILEGERSKVEQLMGKIRTDQRHHSVKIFAEDEVQEEAFKEWFMGIIEIKRRPPAIQSTFRAMFDTFDNTPILLSLDETRIDFFKSLATWDSSPT